jgi:hypothetical protein
MKSGVNEVKLIATEGFGDATPSYSSQPTRAWLYQVVFVFSSADDDGRTQPVREFDCLEKLQMFGGE